MRCCGAQHWFQVGFRLQRIKQRNQAFDGLFCLLRVFRTRTLSTGFALSPKSILPLLTKMTKHLDEK